MGGHGYAVITAGRRSSLNSSASRGRSCALANGGPLRYRVRHTAQMWRPGEAPKLQQTIVEGDVGLAI